MGDEPSSFRTGRQETDSSSHHVTFSRGLSLRDTAFKTFKRAGLCQVLRMPGISMHDGKLLEDY